MQLKDLNERYLCVEFAYLSEHDMLELLNDLDYRMVRYLQTNFNFIKQLLAELFCKHGALTPIQMIVPSNHSLKECPFRNIDLIIEIIHTLHVHPCVFIFKVDVFNFI